MTELKAALQSGEYSCIVRHGGRLIKKSGMGVSPLLSVYNEYGGSLSGCSVADTVVGKAAAAIIILLGAESAYGGIMSEPARKLLAENGVKPEYGQLVPSIQNRNKNGDCPLEQAVAAAATPAEALERIQSFLKSISL